jgi:membrane protein implicated in regulation of membrane protease activity
MEVSGAMLWWILTGTLVAIELATGTFYLLMLAVGTVAGAAAAMLGLGTPAQLIVAALVGGGAVSFWHVRRLRQSRSDEPNAMKLDVGEQVEVVDWDTNGQTRVQYRGTSWQARHQGDLPPAPGPHLIVAVEVNRLVLAPRHR